MKKFLTITLTIIGLLACLAIAGYFEAQLKYGKKIREMEKNFQIMHNNLKMLDSMNKNMNVDLSALNDAIGNPSVNETYKVIENVYDGLLKSSDKGISVENYFMDQKRATYLKEKLQDFIDNINHWFPGKTNFEKGSMLDLSDVKENNKLLTWEEQHFKNIPLAAAIQNLKKINQQVAFTEMKLLKSKSK